MQSNIDPSDFYDYGAARDQGWFISQASGNEDGTTWRLESDDEAGIFMGGDPAAHAFVVAEALKGDVNARRALQFLHRFEPLEAAIVEGYAEKLGAIDSVEEAPEAYSWGTLSQAKLAAIRACANGIWDHPALLEFGPMLPNLGANILFILDTCPDTLRAYCDGI